MKAMEDISESLNSLSNVISTSFMYAKSSPMKAKQSLITCAGFLQNTTMKSTSFFIRFCLVLMNFLKNEHLEMLVLSLISMLQNIVALLNSEDCINLVTSLMRLSGSEHIKKLLTNMAKCIKSLFVILKTDEIATFQTQIWKLIDEDNDNPNNPNNPNFSNNNLYNNINNEFDEKEEEKGEIDASDFSDDSVCENQLNSDIDSTNNGENDGNPSYWSSLTSVFGYNGITGDTPGAHNVKTPGKSTPFGYTKYNGNTIGRDKGNAMKNNNKRRKSAPVISNPNLEHSPRAMEDTDQLYYNSGGGNGGTMTRNGGMGKRGGVGIDDWVLLIEYIDDLEDDGDITISEGDEMRKLAFKQNMALLLIYKCYRNKKTRFIRYAIDIYESNNNNSNNDGRIKEENDESSLYHEHYN